MANSGKNTNGSQVCTFPSSIPNLFQFFITLAPTQWLDGKHTIFGRVAKGMKIVANMGMVKTNARDIPKDKVSVSYIEIDREFNSVVCRYDRRSQWTQKEDPSSMFDENASTRNCRLLEAHFRINSVGGRVRDQSLFLVTA